MNPTHNSAPDNAQVSAIVLAGGASRRMGRDKLRLEVGGVSLLERGVTMASDCSGEIVVVGDGGDLPRAGNVRRVADRRHDRQGPLSGLETGLDEVSGSLLLLVAGDMPFASPGLAEHLLSIVSDGADAAVPLYGGRQHPVFAAYSSGISGVVTETLDAGGRSMSSLLERLGDVRYVEGIERFGDPELLLMNVNSPGDLERAREVAADS